MLVVQVLVEQMLVVQGGLRLLNPLNPSESMVRILAVGQLVFQA